MKVKPIGDRKRKARRSSDLLSPFVASDTFPEGDGEIFNLNI